MLALLIGFGVSIMAGITSHDTLNSPSASDLATWNERIEAQLLMVEQAIKIS